VYTFTSDGGFQILPEGFSYGPSILQVSPNLSTAEGGGTGWVFGYGFGPVGPSTTIPSSLQITVAGNPAQITAFVPQAYPNSAPPFLLQAAAFTIPPGIPGNADVAVTSSSGTATAHAAMNYLPGVQTFALPGSNLAQGIYDPYRDVYYFSDSNKIQVFSKTLGAWLAPITIPAPQGASQRLWGIALSPDGTKLVAADISAAAIYELNPSNPVLVKTFSITSPISGGGALDPVGVAVSDSGMIYYATFTADATGTQFFKLNSGTGAITTYGLGSPAANSDSLLRTVISLDNSRVFFNADGYVFSIDTLADKIFPASVDFSCCYGDFELTLSANQTQFEASSYTYDSNLNGESFLSLNDREILTAQYVYGNKLSPDGTLLFQPSVAGIDVFDGRLGNLLQRVSLPVALSQNYDALVSDGKDNIVVAITGANSDGVAVIDLTSVAEPAPLPFAAASSSRAHRLVQWGQSRAASRTMQNSISSRQAVMPPRIVPHVPARRALPAR
jgi:hypothetical protein